MKLLVIAIIGLAIVNLLELIILKKHERRLDKLEAKQITLIEFKLSDNEHEVEEDA